MQKKKKNRMDVVVKIKSETRKNIFCPIYSVVDSGYNILGIMSQNLNFINDLIKNVSVVRISLK